MTRTTALLKSGLQRLPHPALVRLYHRGYESALRARFEYFRAAARVPLLDFAYMTRFKTSDTVFILGSGSSINAISDARWRTIARHDSFGLNFWLAHPHRPSLYAFEFGTSVWPTFTRLAHQRPDYDGIPKLCTNVHPMAFDFLDTLPPSWRPDVRTSWVVSTLARDTAELEGSVGYLDEQGVFSPATGLGYLFKHRATLVMLLTLAIKLRYRRIVLCGIDLNNAAYFYEDAARYPDMVGFRSSQTGAVHATQQRHTWAMPAADVVHALHKLIMAPAGIELLVENPSSGLHPRVPAAPASLFEDR